MPQLITFPTKDGQQLKIVERIGADYKHLGIVLLNDDTGSKIQAIVADHRQQSHEITNDILIRWLKGGGREPVTWATFVAVLKEVSLTELAKDIEKQTGPVRSETNHPLPPKGKGMFSITTQQC